MKAPTGRLACQNPAVNHSRIIEAVQSERTPLIRTDFRSDAAWQVVVTEVSRPVDFENPDNLDPGDDGYAPNLAVIDDRAFAEVTPAALGEALTDSEDAAGYALLADSRSMTEALVGGEITLDYVDLCVSDPEDAELFDSFMGRAFRCVIAEGRRHRGEPVHRDTWTSTEFADNTAPDGVFRGFDDV